jgi:hypothetical protein
MEIITLIIDNSTMVTRTIFCSIWGVETPLEVWHIYRATPCIIHLLEENHPNFFIKFILFLLKERLCYKNTGLFSLYIWINKPAEGILCILYTWMHVLNLWVLDVPLCYSIYKHLLLYENMLTFLELIFLSYTPVMDLLDSWYNNHYI